MFPRGVNLGLRRQQGLLFGIVVIVFALGVVAGALALQMVTPETSQNLAQRLDVSLQELQSGAVDAALPVQRTMGNYVQTVGLIWFSGLIVVGAPLVLLLVFFRGSILGFTVAFLLTYHGKQGMALVFAGILPGSLFFLPLLWVVGALALWFSISILKGRSNQMPIGKMMVLYFAVGAGLMALAALLGWLEGNVSPWLVRWIMQYV